VVALHFANNPATLSVKGFWAPMNTIQTAFSSPRFNRLLLAIGVVVLAAGALTLVVTLVGGSDKSTINPDKGFKPTLPEKTSPLKNSQGVTVKTFTQLDPEVRTTIRTFLATAVKREHLDQSWSVIAPEMKQGYTAASWSHAKALPIIPYPVADLDRVEYYLDYASTKEILVEVGLSAPKSSGLRPTTFQLALVPVSTGNKNQWLVNYWMPRWTPPIPTSG
jgi:hypothetical protein